VPDEPNPFEGLSEEELVQRLKWLHEPELELHEQPLPDEALADLLASSPTEGPPSQLEERIREKHRERLIEQAEAALQALRDSDDRLGEPRDLWKHEDHEFTTQPELAPAEVVEPPPVRPELETAGAGRSGPSRTLLVGGGILAVALVIAIPLVFVLGGSGSGGSETTPLAAPTTVPATSEPATTDAAPPPAVVHFVIDDRKHDLVTGVALCGGGPQTKGTGNWHFMLRGDVSSYDGKVATLRGSGPGIAGTYHRAVHGGRISISKPLPCAAPGTHFRMGLLRVGAAKAVQVGALG
jgi:hypothetical protein